MKKSRSPFERLIVAVGLSCAVLALAGLAYASGAIDNKQLSVKPPPMELRRTATLKVDLGSGVLGTPASGLATLAAGTVVGYNYSSKFREDLLIVILDGAEVAHSGTIIMRGNHKLEAFIKPVRKFRLKVMETYYQNDIPCHTSTRACGHEGTPACGEAKFAAGAVVSYDLWQSMGQIAGVYLAAYPPAAGCPPSLRDLGGMAPGEHLTGSFVMDRDYTLVISINIE